MKNGLSNFPIFHEEAFMWFWYDSASWLVDSWCKVEADWSTHEMMANGQNLKIEVESGNERQQRQKKTEKWPSNAWQCDIFCVGWTAVDYTREAAAGFWIWKELVKRR